MIISKTPKNNVRFTSFHQGIVLGSAIEIGKLLGILPLIVENDKTTFEWHLSLDNTDDGIIPFTIYDYEKEPIIGDDVYEYHIGTETEKGTATVVNCLRDNIGLNAFIIKYP